MYVASRPHRGRSPAAPPTANGAIVPPLVVRRYGLDGQSFAVTGGRRGPGGARSPHGYSSNVREHVDSEGVWPGTLLALETLGEIHRCRIPSSCTSSEPNTALRI